MIVGKMHIFSNDVNSYRWVTHRSQITEHRSFNPLPIYSTPFVPFCHKFLIRIQMVPSLSCSEAKLFRHFNMSFWSLLHYPIAWTYFRQRNIYFPALSWLKPKSLSTSPPLKSSYFLKFINSFHVCPRVHTWIYTPGPTFLLSSHFYPNSLLSSL